MVRIHSPRPIFSTIRLVNDPGIILGVNDFVDTPRHSGDFNEPCAALPQLAPYDEWLMQRVRDLGRRRDAANCLCQNSLV